MAATPLRLRLPDPDDDMSLQAALSGGAEFLITGSLKHYPHGRREGVTVVTPAEFLDLSRRRRNG